MGETRVFAGYVVTGEVGAGALCTVYQAESAGGRAVAIKALKTSILPGSPLAGQLDREADALAAMTHPNVIALLDRGRDARTAWLVLELVVGVSLAELLAKRPKLAPAAAAAIGAEVARALAHVHQRGWAHRDVKPGNVLLSARGEVKLVDFGIAERVASDRPSRDGALEPSFGTPAYMAPEQILGERTDVRSDLFSLGVVLYQAVAGVRPFEGRGEGTARATGQRIRRDPPVPLRRHAPDVPEELERLVHGLLEKHPDDRPQKAAVVAERLERVARRPTGALVRNALGQAGVPVDAPTEPEHAGVALDRGARDRSVQRLGLQLGAATVAATALVALIEGSGRGPRDAAGMGDRPLELRPTNAGGLRVLASPWAEVIVDGQSVETTPFARAVPLAPGRHFVTLRHPNAPPELREIGLSPGEVVTLDVTMRVP